MSVNMKCLALLLVCSMATYVMAAEDIPNVPAQTEQKSKVSTAKNRQSESTRKVRTLGVCTPTTSAGYSLDNMIEPILMAQGYFHSYEHRDVPGTATITVQQYPKHGKLRPVTEADRGTLFTSGTLDPNAGSHAYLPEQGYAGKDSATILVDFSGVKVQLNYNFQVVDTPLSDDSYALYCSKTGHTWQISSAPPEEIPPPIVITDDTESLASRQITERILSRDIQGKSGQYAAVSPIMFSPDGLRVAYILGFGAKTEQEYGGEGDDGWKKHSLVLDGQKVKHDNVASFQFSPESKHVAYLVYAPNNNEGGVETFFVVDGRESEKYAGQLIGYQFSPDGNHFAFYTSYYAVTDGKKCKAYRGISWITYSPDSKHFAYVASDSNNKYLAIVDEQEGKRYDRVQGPYAKTGYAPLFSPDSKRVAYFATRYTQTVPTITQKNFVVIDGREEGTQFIGVSEEYLAFSPDSQHLLYVASTNEGMALVVDGKAGKGYPSWDRISRVIENPVFSPDSKHVAYVVKGKPNRGETFVVVDGQEGKHYGAKDASIANLRFTPDGKVLYVLLEADTGTLIENGIEKVKFPRYGANYVTFSPDGKHFAYVGTKEKKKRFFVVDGKEEKPYDAVVDPIFSPDGKSFAYAAYTETYTQKDKKWRVVVNGQEGKAYDTVLAKGAVVSSSMLDTGSLRFDGSDRLHYLAISGGNVLLVEEKLKVTGN